MNSRIDEVEAKLKRVLLLLVVLEVVWILIGYLSHNGLFRAFNIGLFTGVLVLLVLRFTVLRKTFHAHFSPKAPLGPRQPALSPAIAWLALITLMLTARILLWFYCPDYTSIWHYLLLPAAGFFGFVTGIWVMALIAIRQHLRATEVKDDVS